MRVHQLLAAFEQRGQAQQHRGGIAAGVADHTSLGDGFAVQFHQAILGFGQDVRAGMGNLVPAFKGGDVLQTEVRSQVDDAGARGDQFLGLGHGHPMGRCEEHHVAVRQRGLFRRGKGELHAAAQVRIHVGDRQSVFLAGRDGGQFHIGMLRQQAQQFNAGVAGAADDADLDAGVRCLGHDVCSS
ncbi:hypothetical protein D9M68_822060 [compost metagenome]